MIDCKRDRALFLIDYRHGLRAAEIRLHQVSDLDLKRLRIRIHRLEGSHGDKHPMQPHEVKVLEAYLDSRELDFSILFPSRLNTPICRRGLDRLVKLYNEKAKLPDDKQHFHVLKYSIATRLLSVADHLRFVQDWLGHANIQNTIIHSHLVSATRDQKARKLFLQMPRF